MNKKSGSTPTSKAENMPKSVPGAQTLRRRAEALALRDLNVPEPGASSLSTSAASLRQTMHELRVHQIELEMQNEELRRKQVELDLSRARYFDLYDLAPVAYCSVSQKGLIVQANLRAATQLGLARSALLGQRFSAFIHRDAQDHFYRLKKQLLDSAEPQSGELELVQRDGTPFWALLQISAGQDASGAALLLVVLSDLSERRQAQALRLELAERLDKIAARLPGMVYQLRLRPDGSAHFPYVSEAIGQIYGVSAAQALADATPVFAALHPDDHDRVVVSLLESAHGERPWVQEYRVRFADGTLRWMHNNALAQREADGGTLWHGFATDITERQLAEDELVAHRAEVARGESLQRLRELNAQNQNAREDERRHVAREIHDELGQQLTALRLGLLLTEVRFCALDPALAAQVADMKALVDRAIQGVRDVATQLRPAALDLGLIPALEWLCADFSKRTSLPCTMRAHASAALLAEVRAVLVFRIVQESLTNIARYAGASQVAVVLTRTGKRQGAGLRLEVRDDGQGFDVVAAYLKNTFGLLGMRERANTLGAQLDIHSNPGAGTHISLTIPLDNAPPKESP